MTTHYPDDDVRDMYDRSADWYAKTMAKEIELPVYDEVLSALAASIADVDGPVVDTSCGSGHMLQRYHQRHDAQRALIGVDLSPRMVAISQDNLGGAATVVVGDMRRLAAVAAGSAAAVISFFALHHLDAADIPDALRTWRRALRSGGRLVLATWEGAGHIDYGDQADLVAHRYTREQVAGWAESAGFDVVSCRVEPVEGMGMDAVYLDAVAP